MTFTSSDASTAAYAVPSPLKNSLPAAECYLRVEPGCISMRGVSLTEAEYWVMRGIAERMKGATC